MKTFLGSVLSAALAAGSPAALAQTKTVQPPSSLELRKTPVTRAVEQIGTAVVNISAERLVRRRTTSFEEFFNFGAPGRQDRGIRSESLGSGVIIDPSGIVVTNDHVVSGASKIYVITQDGKELEAEVLGADADNDLAVLKVDAKGLRAVKLGTTADLMPGESVIAVGNPFGLSNTVTTGIISAVHRTVPGESGRTYSDFIQTDAAINPGNSGGALVNILGELIGINTAIVGGANTIGFAIPIDRVKRITDDLLRFGEVKPVWAGLRGTTVGAESGRPSARGNGMRVRSIYPDSPAEKAGLEEGDVVTAVDGRPVESREDFETFLTSNGPGRKVELTVKRKGKDTTSATLTTGRPPEDLGLEVLRREVGLSVVEARGGLRLSQVARGSQADQKGLERGDLVLAVNGQKVKTLEEVNKAVQNGFSRSALVLVAGRGGYAYTLTFGLE